MAPTAPRCAVTRSSAGSRRSRDSSACSLALVEEPLLDQAGALLGRDLDVAWGEEEHLVGDPLHPAVERVGEPGGEVDQALRQVRVGPLQVQDHRDRVLELVGYLLGVVEALRN